MNEQPPFFVGYLPAASDTKRFAAALVAAILAGGALLALALGQTPTKVDASSYGDELSIAGVVLARPYPLIVAPADARHPLGRTMMLGGEGKHGAQDFGAGLDGRGAAANGVVVQRGDLDMLLIGGRDQLMSAPSLTRTVDAVSRGRWRISGEICDGKCASGAMRPGTGLAHKACAILCVSGGLPPILVSTAPVEGRNFLLLADAGGGPAPATIADLIGLPVTLEGEVEMVGDLPIFRVDWSKASRQ